MRRRPHHTQRRNPELIRERRAREALRRRTRWLEGIDPTPYGCLFCRRRHAEFTSVEHILPEGLGNRLMMLPRGWVCDRCNHGPLATVDQALVEFPGLAMLRVMRGVPRKGDKLPTARWTHAHAYIDTVAKVPAIEAEHGARVERIEGGFSVTLNKSWGRSTKQRANVGRALYKIALEATLLFEGPRLAYDEALDDLRGQVLGDNPSGWFGLSPASARPHDQLTLSLEAVDVEEPALTLLADFYSLVLFTEYLWRDPAMAGSVQAALAIHEASIVEF